MVQLIEIIQEYMKMLKNVSIYSDFGRYCPIGRFIFQSMALMKRADANR